MKPNSVIEGIRAVRREIPKEGKHDPKRLVLLLGIGLIILSFISNLQAEKKDLNSIKESSKGTKSTQIKESPLDKALIGLWQAIDVVNRFAVVVKADRSSYLITPRGAITTNRPIFEWTSADNASGYRIHLYDSQGNGWKPETSAPKFVYPESGEELACGTYTWKVEILTGEAKEGEFSEPVRFKIIPAQEKSQLEKELPSAKELLVNDYILLGSSYLKHQFFNEAISNFQKAMDVAPDNPYAHLGLAQAYKAIARDKEAKEEFEKAISIFKQAIKITPTNPDLHAGLALTYEAVGKTEEAQAEWEKAKGSEAYYLYKNETR